MTFPSSTLVLLLLGVVVSLAADDLGSIELDGLLPDPSPDDAFNSPAQLTAGGVRTWNNVLASGTTDETVRGAEILDPGKNDDVSTECIPDANNAPTRVRRDDVSCPPRNNPQLNGAGQQNNPKTPNSSKKSNIQNNPGRAPRPLIPESPDIFQPGLNFKWPEANLECDLEPPYQDCKIAMCDSGDRRDIKVNVVDGVIWVTLSKANPCTWIS